jgi:glycerophosphoryl diester phosphodiesterase
MQIYAHRAGRGLAPENTLYACQEVLGLGVDFIDFDVGMTKDRQLVATHDVTLNRDLTRNAEGNFVHECPAIFDLTYDQLSTFNVGQINPYTKYASYFPQQKSLDFAKIPLLNEAIEYILASEKKSTGFQFEIKTDPRKDHLTAPPEAFAQALFQVIHRYNLYERCEVQSFDFRSLFFLQKINPLIKTTYLVPPRRHISLAFLKKLKTFRGSCIGPFQMDVSESLIHEAKALGMKVVPWGYPEKEGCEFNTTQIAKLIAWGVDGIVTDRPDKLRQMLAK